MSTLDARDVRQQILDIRMVWILVDEDGTARIARPSVLHLEVFGRTPPEHPAGPGGYSVHAALDVVQHFLVEHTEWTAAVSIPTGVVEQVKAALPPNARELTLDEISGPH